MTQHPGVIQTWLIQSASGLELKARCKEPCGNCHQNEVIWLVSGLVH